MDSLFSLTFSGLIIFTHIQWTHYFHSHSVDSVLLAAVLHSCVPSNQPIELLNVTFEAPSPSPSPSPSQSQSSSPDRLAALAALVELEALFPSREWRLVLIDVSAVERQLHERHIKAIIQPCDTHMDLNIGTAFWFASRGQVRISANFTTL